MKILISACLLGLPCRYDGASKPQLWVEELARRHELIPMCPEQMGGLPTPRNPSERREDRVVMRTGDSKAAAEHIGSVVGVDEVIPEVLPEEKALHVQKLEAEGRRVMKVGDGINDAPALTAATVGCAIGSGSDIAIESADIVLMRSDLEDVPRALRLSALTLRDIKQNLFWAFCYNTVGIPIAAGLLYAFGGPLLSPMFAGAAMSLSSVCVVGNALRLGTVKL